MNPKISISQIKRKKYTFSLIPSCPLVLFPAVKTSPLTVRSIECSIPQDNCLTEIFNSISLNPQYFSSNS